MITTEQAASSENPMPQRTYMDVEDLDVYRRLCQLHIDVCDLTHLWPPEERYELGSQVRRSSNSSPAQLAEKNDDRHVRNKVEGVNRSRGEAGETIHHLYMALLKKYVSGEVYAAFRTRYKECIRMLNGLEKTLERKLPETDRRWHVAEDPIRYERPCELDASGWPTPDT
jgi:four helix bundle protein